jgi:hypothetical protein
VTLRIETLPQGRPVVRLSGRMRCEHLAGLQRYIDAPNFKPLLDLEQLTLVDVEAVRFLIDCEESGVELLHCSPYIRAWMEREQANRR